MNGQIDAVQVSKDIKALKNRMDVMENKMRSVEEKISSNDNDNSDVDEKKEQQNEMKYVFVTGGVVSGLGKGITASSIGLLMKQAGLTVTAIKIDPYLNIDAGTVLLLSHTPSLYLIFISVCFHCNHGQYIHISLPMT